MKGPVGDLMRAGARRITTSFGFQKKMMKTFDAAVQAGQAPGISRQSMKKLVAKMAKGKDVPMGDYKKREAYFAVAKEAGYTSIKTKNPTGYFRSYKKLFSDAVKATETEDDDEPVISKTEQRKKESLEKRRMWDLARERRAETDKQKGAIRSLGLKEWQSSTTSVGKAVEEKERERHQDDEQDWRSKPAIDTPID